VDKVSDTRNPSFIPLPPFLFGDLIYSSYICLMKTFVKILLFVSFIMSFIFVGGMVVDGIMSLFPASASEWFPVIRFILWIFTFTFNLILTFILYFILVYIISVVMSLLM
jgi:hypothetical protein